MKKIVAVFATAFIVCCTAYASEQFDEWNPDAPALHTLIGYIETVTDPVSSEYIPPEDRIVVFDMDGTLFPELNPAYFSDYLLAHRILTDPSFEPDDEMLDHGAAGEDLRERWEKSGYQIISMEKDWRTIYGEGVVKTGSFHWMEDLTDEANWHF